MSNKLYDKLKIILTVGVDAGVTCFLILTKAWGWDIPNEAIVTTVTAVSACLGVWLNISSGKYNKELEDKGDGDNTETDS